MADPVRDLAVILAKGLAPEGPASSPGAVLLLAVTTATFGQVRTAAGDLLSVTWSQQITNNAPTTPDWDVVVALVGGQAIVIATF